MKKTVLITGGNKGIGLETTKKFLQQGYEVIVVARDFTGFEFKENQNVRCIEFDLSDVNKVPELVAMVESIDVLINNAGVMYSLPYDDYPKEKVDFMIALNIEVPVKLIELFSKKMPDGARIVNDASIAGQIGHPDVWYGITKAGLINATKSFAKIFDGRIIINAVAPSPVETDMLHVIPEARREAFLKTVTAKRFAYAEEVAKTMVWLATEAPEYINGACIDINSGSYMR